MTTVAYFDGVLAADRLCCSSNRREGYVRKIARRRSDGSLIAAAGGLAVASSYIDWFLNGEVGKPPSLGTSDADDAELIVVRPGRKVWFYDRNGRYQIKSKFLAMGSGADFALGALEAGASARDAVKIAIRRDTYSGGGVNAYSMD